MIRLTPRYSLRRLLDVDIASGVGVSRWHASGLTFFFRCSSDDLMPALLLSVSRGSVDSTAKGMADLEPFVRRLRNSSAPSRDLHLEMCRGRKILIAST